MIKLIPEQLNQYLTNKGLQRSYFLFGDDPFLLQESYEIICKIAVLQGFEEHHSFIIDNYTNWQVIFSICQEVNIFTTRQTLQIVIPENSSTKIISKYMIKLVNLLHDDLILIIRGSNFAKLRKNHTWFNQLINYSILVTCYTPKQFNFKKWIINRANQNNIQLDEESYQLLYYYYEGNLAELVQIIEQLALLYPNKKLTFPVIKDLVNNVAHFNPFQWIDALFQLDSKRALYILRNLQREGVEPLVLIRILQREMLLILAIKRQNINNSAHRIFDKYQIWQSHREILINTKNRLNQNRINQVIQLLTYIELNIKQNNSIDFIWLKLENISFILCNEVELKL